MPVFSSIAAFLFLINCQRWEQEEIKLSMNDYMELRFKKSYGIATYVCDEMGKILHTQLHEHELGYLAMHIQRCIEEIESEIKEDL